MNSRVDHTESLGQPRPFGWHLVLDLHGCDPDLIKNKEAISSFALKLVKLIQMRAFGEPWVEKIGTAGTDAEGITLVQLIETSALVAHFSEYIPLTWQG